MVNKKKIKKSIESLDKQIKEHEEKIKDYCGKDYTLLEYWKKEIEVRKKQKEKKLKKLRRIIK